MDDAAFASRPWASQGDTRLIQALASDHLRRDWPAADIHPGDLDWWQVQTVGGGPGMDWRVRLWFDAPTGRPIPADAPLLAFGWVTPPGDLDFLIGPEDPVLVQSLLREMVAWAAERRASFGVGSDLELVRAWAVTDDRGAVECLVRLGLVREAEEPQVHFTGDLAVADPWPAPSLPAGLVIRPLDPSRDVPARVACARAVFTGSTMTVERYRTVFDAPTYRPELDLQVVAEDGRIVGFALGWLDAGSGVVELEPVGVHPDWHRRGLGREICRATLRAARALGASRALVATGGLNGPAMALYADLGLSVTCEIWPFARPLPGAGA
jgi:GNAT superfamily N-acetyltransferase